MIVGLADASGSSAASAIVAAGATADAATSQPTAGGDTIDTGQDVKLQTLPCAALTGPIALKATLGDSTAGVSATSPYLYYDDDFACGDRIDFIVRPAAMAGLVVGYDVQSGAAD